MPIPIQIPATSATSIQKNNFPFVSVFASFNAGSSAGALVGADVGTGVGAAGISVGASVSGIGEAVTITAIVGTGVGVGVPGTAEAGADGFADDMGADEFWGSGLSANDNVILKHVNIKTSAIISLFFIEILLNQRKIVDFYEKHQHIRKNDYTQNHGNYYRRCVPDYSITQRRNKCSAEIERRMDKYRNYNISRNQHARRAHCADKRRITDLLNRRAYSRALEKIHEMVKAEKA